MNYSMIAKSLNDVKSFDDEINISSFEVIQKCAIETNTLS